MKIINRNNDVKIFDIVKLSKNETIIFDKFNSAMDKFEANIEKNSVGTVIFQHIINPKLYEVEFISKDGKTRKVATIEVEKLVLIEKKHINKRTFYYG